MGYDLEYKWQQINEPELKQVCKENDVTMCCTFCQAALIDKKGKKRTRDRIWQYGTQGIVIGYSHERCCKHIKSFQESAGV